MWLNGEEEDTGNINGQMYHLWINWEEDDRKSGTDNINECTISTFVCNAVKRAECCKESSGGLDYLFFHHDTPTIHNQGCRMRLSKKMDRM